MSRECTNPSSSGGRGGRGGFRGGRGGGGGEGASRACFKVILSIQFFILHFPFLIRNVFVVQ